MTLATNPVQDLFPAGTDNQFSGTTANFTFDASTDLVSAVFHIPATGTIANVHYRVATVSTPVMTHRVGLYTVDATTGFPTATLYSDCTAITVVDAAITTGNKTAAVNCAATAGDLVALVFDLSAFTSGSFTQQQRFGSTMFFAGMGAFPYHHVNSTGSAANGGYTFNSWGLEYGTDTYHMPEMPAMVGTLAAVTVTNSGVTRRGNRLRPAVPRRAIGIWVEGDLDGDCFLRLRLQSDDSLLATATLDDDYRGLLTAGGVYRHMFDAGATVDVTAGTDYYVLVEGNSATTDTIYHMLNIPENAMLDQLSGGMNCYGTSYNAGYTDANTTRCSIGLIFDQADDGTGGAAGGLIRHPAMAGGCNA